jgi:hypothetical protein
MILFLCNFLIFHTFTLETALNNMKRKNICYNLNFNVLLDMAAQDPKTYSVIEAYKREHSH